MPTAPEGADAVGVYLVVATAALKPARGCGSLCPGMHGVQIIDFSAHRGRAARSHSGKFKKSVDR